MIGHIKVFILGLLAVFTLDSCSSDNKAEIKEVEELNTKISLLKNSFETVEMDQVDNAIKSYFDNTSN